jgi:hypothetical protein
MKALFRIEAFHLRVGEEDENGMDRDNTRGTYRALCGQRGNANVKACGEFAPQNRPRLEPMAGAFVLTCAA